MSVVWYKTINHRLGRSPEFIDIVAGVSRSENLTRMLWTSRGYSSYLADVAGIQMGERTGEFLFVREIEALGLTVIGVGFRPISEDLPFLLRFLLLVQSATGRIEHLSYVSDDMPLASDGDAPIGGIEYCADSELLMIHSERQLRVWKLSAGERFIFACILQHETSEASLIIHDVKFQHSHLWVELRRFRPDGKTGIRVVQVPLSSADCRR